MILRYSKPVSGGIAKAFGLDDGLPGISGAATRNDMAGRCRQVRAERGNLTP
jgi:hypothetical protein